MIAEDFQVFQVLQTAFNYFPSSSQRLGNFKISLIMPQKIDCRDFRNWTDYWFTESVGDIPPGVGEICHFDLENHDDHWTLNQNFTCGGGNFRVVMCKKAFDLFVMVSN